MTFIAYAHVKDAIECFKTLAVGTFAHQNGFGKCVQAYTGPPWRSPSVGGFMGVKNLCRLGSPIWFALCPQISGQYDGLVAS